MILLRKRTDRVSVLFLFSWIEFENVLEMCRHFIYLGQYYIKYQNDASDCERDPKGSGEESVIILDYRKDNSLSHPKGWLKKIYFDTRKIYEIDNLMLQ